jgi:hypothetical protein
MYKILIFFSNTNESLYFNGFGSHNYIAMTYDIEKSYTINSIEEAEIISNEIIKLANNPQIKTFKIIL